MSITAYYRAAVLTLADFIIFLLVVSTGVYIYIYIYFYISNFLSLKRRREAQP
jgi:hypothetical protein